MTREGVHESLLAYHMRPVCKPSLWSVGCSSISSLSEAGKCRTRLLALEVTCVSGLHRESRIIRIADRIDQMSQQIIAD